MARIEGVDLPRNKRIDIALTSIYGIGRYLAAEILEKAGVERSRRTFDLTVLKNYMFMYNHGIFRIPG